MILLDDSLIGKSSFLLQLYVCSNLDIYVYYRSYVLICWMRASRSILRVSRRHFSVKRRTPIKMASGERIIELTETESRLRRLLLDASTYIGVLEGGKKPELRITGGWVRDKLLGITSHDIDIGIDNMTGFKFAMLLRQYLELPEIQAIHPHNAMGSLAKIEANPEKSKHLETVATRIMGFDIDLVNLRKEAYSDSSRNPTMDFGSPREDALRRDATVNALFYNLQTAAVEDFTERGLADMEKRVIKTPLAPLQTFKDDPLRILRCIRFASRLDYRIAIEDEIAMADDSIKAALRLKISRERVGVEITKMLNSKALVSHFLMPSGV